MSFPPSDALRSARACGTVAVLAQGWRGAHTRHTEVHTAVYAGVWGERSGGVESWSAGVMERGV